MTQHNNDSDARMMRGMAISEGNRIVENPDGSFAVPSQTTATIVYDVRLLGAVWVCNCPDFENRKVQACKHIYAVKFWIATNTFLENQPKPKILAEDSMQCSRCGSIRVIHYGRSSGKQVYFCNDCKHKFREESLIKKAKYNTDIITLTLDLYFSGLSLRKIARTINDNFNLDIDFSTIYTWIRKYIPMISDYVNSLSPQLSDTWHADELFVKMKGGITYQRNKGMAFLWNIMDRKTRFLIASKLSQYRDSNGALKAFEESIQNAHDSKPEYVLTDSNSSYNDGIKWSFYSTKDPKHIANCGIGKKPHATNNRIERLNGTLRERVKVQRGWKSIKTPIAEGMRIQYNFVKPHMALDGQTPAERAGILVAKGRNKWMDLLELTFESNQ